MKTWRSSGLHALLALGPLVLLGCSSATTVRLTGTPGTQVSGHYRADHVSSDFAGSAAWKMDLSNRHLEEFEFRKATVAHSVDLEIRQGRTQLVHATADPGTLGLRVRSEDGWKVETLK